tara:strand:+ start:332 stop:730 length:399 start_codon:yes stop_codon:yes gene_type:complete
MKLRMNKIWKLLVVALVITTTACGQQRGLQGGQQVGNQQSPPVLPTSKEIKTMVSDLSVKLLLSDEQEERVLELYISHFKVVESKTKSGRPDRTEMEKLKEDFEENVKAILTEDQQKLFTAYQKKNNKRERS